MQQEPPRPRASGGFSHRSIEYTSRSPMPQKGVRARSCTAVADWPSDGPARGRPPKRIELEQRDNRTRKNARNYARDNERLPLRYVGHAQHSSSINARAFSFWVDWLMLPSRFGPTGHVVARRFERFFRHDETQRAGCPIAHATAQNASISRPRERKNHGFVESRHRRRRRRARRFVA